MGLFNKPKEPEMGKVMTSPVPAVSKPITISFSDAMGEVVNKKKITRVEWDNPEEYGLLKNEYLIIHTKGADHKWLVSEADMMATDWLVIP
jgi:hypothetical protein